MDKTEAIHKPAYSWNRFSSKRTYGVSHVYKVSLNTPTVIGHQVCFIDHNFDILMKAFAMFLAFGSKNSRKFIEMALDEMSFYSHFAV